MKVESIPLFAMRRGLATLLVALMVTANAFSAGDGHVTARMRIGTIDEHHTAVPLEVGASRSWEFPAPGEGGYMRLRTVIPDDIAGHWYSFEVRVNGNTLQKRSGHTSGFGRRTFFIPLEYRPLLSARKLRVEILNISPEALLVEELLPLPGFDKWLSASVPPDDFFLSFLVHTHKTEFDYFGELRKLGSAAGVRKAVSTEVHYANTSETVLRERLGWLREQCAANDLPFLAIPCSWWAGTAREVKDRVDFQQICWSETDTHDEGPELRELLGDQWDLRYGFTRPNMWANVPWQTMNNPELNTLRHKRMRAAVRIVEEVMKEHLIGYVSENEPAYWAWEAADFKYPVRRVGLLADFNPHTVAAAKADGVDLDPRNGLGIRQRMWLHQNVARYVQNCIDVLTSAGASTRIYSHALLAQHFPMQGTGRWHPYSEVARVRGARTGLETLWHTDMDGLWRVREWGPWGCVNREENDGVAIGSHLAMLQAEFMLGADLFNSYNWNAINQDGRAIAYFNDFLRNLADEGGIVVAGERKAGDDWKPVDGWGGPLNVRNDFPWSNAIELDLKPPATTAPLAIELTRGISGAVLAYALVDPEQVKTGETTRVDFGDITQVEHDSPVYLRLKGTGWQARFCEDGPRYRLIADLRLERRRSQSLTQQ